MAEPDVRTGQHPLLVAVRPLAERLGARLVGPDCLRPEDVPLEWQGELVGAVRLPAAPGAEGPDAPETAGTAVQAETEPGAGLAQLLDGVADELGGSLESLPRSQKQRAVRLLEERGAFSYRKSAETIAEALGVSRFTVYNYLNRQR